MDYYSLDSEVIESLNVLRPPVKRDPRSSKVFFEYYNNHNINFRGVRDLNQNNKFPEEEDGNSSTSLILKKTSEKQNSTTSSQILHSQAPQESKRPIDKNKPLIKVSVIPKPECQAGIKLQDRIVPKIIQAASSNHESSIQTNNEYLIVVGREKDKIYEIKTTGSVNFKPEPTEDGVVAVDCNYEQYTRTNNMERKKKKSIKTEAKINKQNQTQANGCNNLFNIEHLCDCLAADEEPYDVKEKSCNCPSEDEVVHEVRPGKSRLRIFGQLGITEGDQYMLKCQATVDDIPVPMSSSTGENKYDMKPTRRDFVMQTENRNNTKNKLLMVDIKNKISKDSHSTQVNFNNPNDNNKNRLKFCTTNQFMECNCGLEENPANTTKNTEHEEKNLKSCQHPLVIISVFPKPEHKSHFHHHENDDNNFSNLVKTVQCAHAENLSNALKEQILPENNSLIYDTPEENGTVITKTKNVRSRSPTPRSPKSKPKEKKMFESNKLKKTNARNETPFRSNLPKKEQSKGMDSPKQTLRFHNSNIIKESNEATKKTRKLSPDRSPSGKSPVANSNKKEPRRKKSKSPTRRVDKGINTEHLEAKKALVESYTKTICEQMASNKKKPPATSVSRVSVNIDNEKDYYDVSFRQDKFTTDLSVRKTMKEASVQKYFNENRKHGSKEIFHPKISKKRYKSRISQSICENQSNDVDLIVNTARRFTLRDSIELLQRREDKYKNMQTGPTTEHLTENIDDMDFLAPIKHFTGDNCTICDPVERDQEIKELLGVEGRKTNTKLKDSHIHDIVIGDEISRHCFYPDECKQTYMAEFSVHDEEFTCPVRNNKYSKKYCHCSVESLSKINNKIEQEKANAEDFRYCEQRHSGNAISGPTHGIKFIVKQKSKDSKQINNCGMTVNRKTDTERRIDWSCNTNMEYKYDRRRMVDANETNVYQLAAHEKSDLKATSLYHHLTFNRNIQVFLQVDLFKKEKTIALTRQQYKKVKRTIQNTLKTSEKMGSYNRSSICAVKEKRGRKYVSINKEKCCQKSQDAQTSKYDTADDRKVGKDKWTETYEEYNQIQHDKDTIALFSTQAHDSLEDKKPKVSQRQAVSSVEVRYSNVEYLKHVTFSTTNMGSIGSSSYANRNHYSIETLFRGHRKPPTPNLGTSALSLVSEGHISQSQSVRICPPNAKAKKPFLKRLMSCLVMRSSTASDMKMKTGRERQPQTVNSSIDSYHISTSFGGVEMTSSLYDTSVSFCSDRSIHPLSSKLKQGFLASVKGFLTSRKS